ncbi:MAG: TIGR00159 family protein [Candidatus Omnitrophica bacterium CG12_big_fil_rev_8_21_14_0_65_43_15]|uniref:Diadenylate cyclase n=1 Tax=Candidatus Taenaricola geysiri TaxID=1974752 RepID=A0A2J0LSY0_9BACT|nr:MAG: TIGR00159 family protein [Candidatus Omnitrophica bacterium CG1_02_43_210]PIR65991.1 MAG: TIGR00159 family protein [Candidatus Omnitrophica bacterium CG10_big_fil_rev_8_21_14_0_10_43_8]PIV12280.1 MAG: TIGR00159 family protein [Candidatus Omnitrophica bacterium CG03_land_8_20_14_0_80_43_22]PIW66927.1 MAG: TIGR00159 family protein [Candidatus Omnitrophica bacterium CG12_big_fil_rev_8_21_14_0_65_43_15]PIW79810.1 MAG: TIGR00159 family protein [Candidatus Omnitrophica bacterium CG_4_8_14_3_u
MIEKISIFWKPFVEIFVLWFVYYTLLVFLKGTRAIQVLRGLVVLVFAFFLAQYFEFYTLNWILSRLLAISVIAFLILFQPELRRGFASLGQRHIFNILPTEEKVIEELSVAAVIMSRKKVGALIAIEREASLRSYVESGVALDSKVTSELLCTIFTPSTPLHDGGVVVHNDRISFAGCLFPLTENPRISKILGTRHRAAIGLTEETDAVVIVVSEETGGISIAIGGKLTRELDKDGLVRILKNLYNPGQKSKNFWKQLAIGGPFRYGIFSKFNSEG